MGRIERTLLTAALCAWLLLGLAHTAIVLAGPRGLRPDRSAPGADAVVGHPGDTDARLVAGPRRLVERVGADGRRLLLVLPEATDSTSLLYARYQLAHVLYPRRVEVIRATPGSDPIRGRHDDALIVAAAAVELPAECRSESTALGYSLLECAP